MIRLLRNQLDEIRSGVKNGVGLGLGLIFLTLIGIPSDSSQELAALTIPLYLGLSAGITWYVTRQITLKHVGKTLKTAVALGFVTSVVLLLFLGFINRWHASGVNVTGTYFNQMGLYPMQVLSGVPREELFPNPKPDPITGEFADGQQMRTNPMNLYFSEEYAILSLGGLHLGGFIGLGILLTLAAVIGALAQNSFQRVDWQVVREGFWEWMRSGRVGQQIPVIGHWMLLSLPLLLFMLLWLTISQPLNLGFLENFGVDSRSSFRVIDLRQVFNITSTSLVNDVTIQLAISFLIVISGIVAVRGARITTNHRPYGVRLALLLGVLGFLMVLAVWRIEAKPVSLFAPSFDLLGLSGHDYTNIAFFLISAGVIAYVIKASRDPNRFEMVYAAATAGAVILMTPLFMDQYQSFIMGRVGLAVMFGLGLNIVVGYAGLLDLGYVAFYAIGAYVFAFIAVENNQAKISVAQLNNVGWLIVAVFIFAPLVLFAGTNLLHTRWRTRPPSHLHPRIQHQSRVWEDQPPWYISLLLVAAAVTSAIAAKALLTEVGLFKSEQFSSFLVVTLVAMMAAAFIGIILGVPVLRLRGDYLAIVTLGFGEIISLALKNLDSTTGGPSGAIGIPKPVPAGTSVETTNLIMLYLSIIGATVIVLVSVRLRHSRLGRAWMAIHSNEDIAQAMGINLVNVKLLAFSIGASFAGLAGMIFASRQNSIFPDDFGLEVSINVLSLIIIGGMGSIPGVVVGAIVLIGLPELLRPVADYRIMAFGLLLIVTMVVLPDGLMPSPPPQLEEEARRLAEKMEQDK